MLSPHIHGWSSWRIILQHPPPSPSPLKIPELWMCQSLQFTVRHFSLISLVLEEGHSRIIFLSTLPCNNYSEFTSPAQQPAVSSQNSNPTRIGGATAHWWHLESLSRLKTPDALCAHLFWFNPDKTVMEEYFTKCIHSLKVYVAISSQKNSLYDEDMLFSTLVT